MKIIIANFNRPKCPENDFIIILTFPKMVSYLYNIYYKLGAVLYLNKTIDVVIIIHSIYIIYRNSVYIIYTRYDSTTAIYRNNNYDVIIVLLSSS